MPFSDLVQVKLLKAKCQCFSYLVGMYLDIATYAANKTVGFKGLQCIKVCDVKLCCKL